MPDHQLDLVDHLDSLTASESLYTISQAMTQLDISRPTLYRRMSDLGIVSHKIKNKGYLDSDMMGRLADIDRPKVSSPLKSNQDPEIVVSLLQEISDKLSLILSLMDSKQAKTDTPQNTISQTANATRARETKERILTGYQELKKAGKVPIKQGKPNLTALAKILGVGRGSVSKYLSDIV